jgi:hypothetical protein
MSCALFAPVCAITSTRRRRFMWAAWWTGAPCRTPFRKPDAFQGGARTRAEALRAAERAAGCRLSEIDGLWARAFANLLIGQEPWPKGTVGTDGSPRPRARAGVESSIWQTLGLEPSATLAEVKRAYRQRALLTHPDRGGSDAAFRAVQAAYEAALKRRKHAPKAR